MTAKSFLFSCTNFISKRNAFSIEDAQMSRFSYSFPTFLYYKAFVKSTVIIIIEER